MDSLLKLLGHSLIYQISLSFLELGSQTSRYLKTDLYNYN